jgi:hypothetical protein
MSEYPKVDVINGERFTHYCGSCGENFFFPDYSERPQCPCASDPRTFHPLVACPVFALPRTS